MSEWLQKPTLVWVALLLFVAVAIYGQYQYNKQTSGKQTSASGNPVGDGAVGNLGATGGAAKSKADQAGS
jgi:hypothetical protein